MAGKNEFSFDQLMNDLKNKIYHPVYLLHGEEPYFIDVISDFIEQNILNDLEKEFNLTIVYGKDSNVPTLASYARRFPMMANYHVLIVKEAQELDKIEELQSYVDKPLSSTILVLCYKYGKVDKRKTFYKSIEKQGVVFESARLYDNKIPDWINNYLHQQNYTINPKAAALLAEFLGSDLGKIVNEIQKLLINLAPGSAITEEDVEKNIGISKDYNVFELQKALAQKDIVKSNRIILHFAANPRENPLVKVIPILFAYFSKVLTYHYLTDKSRNSVASALSVNPFFVNDYLQAARSFPVARIIQIISILREYDLKSKGVENNATYAGDGELMKEIIFKILH
ncbi:MAG: DNA polymerase III subunit delta [Bacteroidales bacterium]|jgi:DNA polymerase-3 subunit delta|nr:DNA polymerase III subunit delta [Bacteroidales bacterium]